MDDNTAKTEMQALQDFLLDTDCLDKLSSYTNQVNIYDILKISRTEIRHSNILAWLFEPNGNHNLNEDFLRYFFQEIVTLFPTEFPVFRFLLMDYSSFSIMREWVNIDILLVSDKEKIVIAIENKIDSDEHDDQLDKYSLILKAYYKDYLIYHLYLTPDGRSPLNSPDWLPISYSTILTCLNSVETHLLDENVKYLLEDYADIVRRDIVNNDELMNICNEIYSKHRLALDLIYAYRNDFKKQVYNIFSELPDSLGIIYKPDNISLHFCTRAMNEILGYSMGNSDLPYIYELIINDDPKNKSFYIRLVFYVKKSPELDTKREQLKSVVADLYQKKYGRADSEKYNTIFSTSKNTFSGDSDLEEWCKQAISGAIAEIKAMEEQLLAII